MNDAITIIVMLVVLIGFPYAGSVIIGKMMQKRQTMSKLDDMLFRQHEED